MRCIALTSRWAVKPCPNNAKCDGYCYAHHPSVVLAKLRLYERVGLKIARDYQLITPGLTIAEQIRSQKSLLLKIDPPITQEQMDRAKEALL